MIETLLLVAASVLIASAVAGRIARADSGPAAGSLLRSLTVVALALGIVSTATVAALLLGNVGPTPDPPRLPILGILCVLVALTFWYGRRGRAAQVPVPPPRPTVRAPRALLVLLAVAALAAGYVVVERLRLRPDGESDAFSIWNLHARLLHRASGDASIVFSSRTGIGHPDYPLLLPGLVAAGWRLTIDGDAWVTGAVALLFGALTAAALYAAIAPRRGATAASLAVLAWLATPLVLRQVPLQLADVPLSAFLVLSLAWLATAYDGRGGERSGVAFAGVCASLGAWTKNEGVVPLLAIGLVLAARPPAGLSRFRALRAYAMAALPFLAVLVAFKVGLAPANDIVAGTTASSALDRLGDPSRYGTIARHALGELVRSSHWNLLLPVGIVGAVVAAARGGAARRVGAVLGLVMAGYLAVYVVTPKPLAWHLATSFDRLLLQLWPSLLLVSALGTRPDVLARPEVSPSPAPSSSAAGS